MLSLPICEPAPYRDLIAWQRAFDLATDVCVLTASSPKEELFGIAAQLRRASVSVVSNIAEEAGRRTTRDYLSFLHIARGPLAELKTQLLLAGRVGLLSDFDTWIHRTSELGRLLNAVICGLRKKIRSAAPGR